jgi:addiction module HigA family antidote
MTMKRTTELIPLMNFFVETLRETLDEWDVSQAEVSRMTGIPSPHLTDMKKNRRRCTPEYDLRLSRYFGTCPGFWLRLQLDFELRRAERENGEKITREVAPHAA